MRVKKIIIIISLSLIAFIILSNLSLAEATVSDIIDGMSGVKEGMTADTSKGIGKVINIIIGLLQVAGTGISVIVVTVLGIKYIVASVEEKAEIKKQAVPIVIGCILLFGAVNIMAALEEFGKSIS